MKVLTVVGARPQFIKAAALSRTLRQRHVEVLVHTGQHYDPSLSDVFFEELDIPKPDHHLGVGSGPHGRQTGQMLERLETVVREESPDWAVVFGDTNSTLAGALAAAKLGVPLAHVEAGLRSFNRSMPEEINRIVADHCADVLFSPTQTAVANLEREGLAARSHLTGDIMYDSLLQQLPRAKERSDVMKRLGVRPGGFFLATIHRPSNTDDQEALGRIFDALAMLDSTVILPIHPRTRLALARGDLETPPQVRVIDPLGYLDMLVLQESASMVLTDSGGVQKEAYLLATPCVTLREETEWPETLTDGWNVLAGNDTHRIVEAARRNQPEGGTPLVFGDGTAARAMVELLSHDPPERRCLD